jgi:gamma-glutamylcyclotransferase (GGCT)/AIG2-like uncharacterized protein YtfP
MLYLFSYGSNNSKQLAQRVKRQGGFKTWPGYLENHVRIFADYTQRWKGGVASVHSLPGKRVYGNIVEITSGELAALDRFEEGYTRVIKKVYCQSTHSYLDCFVYVKNDHSFSHLPSEAYLRAISKMLLETERVNKSKILIRGITPRGAVKVYATWTPDDGLQIKK